MDHQGLSESIAAGIQYLLAQQSAVGSWVDWALPPGPSDMWTTGFVGYKLSSLENPHTHEPQVRSAVRRASAWLENAVLEDAGWGYNATVGSDADSTAYAILFLASQDCSVRAGSYARLRQFQCDDGGFSTYCSDGPRNSWMVSHPDVSAVALLALLTNCSSQNPLIVRGVHYLLRQRTPLGLWHSFWWNSPLYSTGVNLTLLNSLQVPIDAESMSANLAEMIPTCSFEAALQLRCLLSVKVPVQTPALRRLTEQLIREQQDDGSWTPKPILRITHRTCFEPWKAREPGRQFADPKSLFTTSTVLEALCLSHTAYSGGS